MAELSFTLSPITFNSLSGVNFQTEQKIEHATKDKRVQNMRE